MASEQHYDMIALFRQAATAMSAGILLVLIGTPQQLAIIGLIFLIYSFVLLVAAFIQIFPICHKFPEFMGKFNDELTMLFILISLFSIIRNWAAITTAINDSVKTVEQCVLWVQSVSFWGILVWLVGFFIAFTAVAIVDISRTTKKNMEKLGFGRGLLLLLASTFYALGCFGIVQSFGVTFNLALFILSLLVTIGTFVYLVCQKDKIKKANIGTT